MAEFLRVRRLDNEQVLDRLSLADLRWWIDTGHPHCKWTVTRDSEHRLRGDVPYVRECYGSPWGVRVIEIPPENSRPELPRIGSVLRRTLRVIQGGAR